ncbi:MAG TPA: hypothetical protein DCP07_04190 [Lachnospiraceae bacterium]|nr:hypothetical protein [Lachnospiraceae bacterium]
MKKILPIVNIIIGALLIIGPQTFLHVCKGSMMGMTPPCKDIPIWSLVAGIILIIVSLAKLVLIFTGKESKVAYIVTGLAEAVIGVVAIGIPTFIVGTCKSQHMHCHMVTKPALIMIGAVIIITAVAGLIVNKDKKAE